MSDDLHRRLEAVERAVTGGETAVADLSDAATLDARLTAVETRLDDLDATVQELDATTQALRGYLGGVDEVSAAVEQRADLALAKAEALERAVFDDDADALAVERLSTDTDTAAEPAAQSDGEPSPVTEDALRDDSGISSAGTTPTGSSSVSSHREIDHATDDPASSLAERLRDAL